MSAELSFADGALEPGVSNETQDKIFTCSLFPHLCNIEFLGW